MFTVTSLIQFVGLLIVVGLIFGLLHFLVRRLVQKNVLPEPYATVIEVVLLVVGVLVLISLLLWLIGYPIIPLR